nr:hypothetical protein [Lysinibacillus sphaericus]
MERFQVVGTYYLDSYLYWYRWPELHKNLAFENRRANAYFSLYKKSNYFTVEILRKDIKASLKMLFRWIRWFIVI